MTKICPTCKKKSEFLNNTCEHCGCKIIVCEECGAIAHESKTSCDNCGYVFSIKQDQKREERAMSLINNAKRQDIVYICIATALVALFMFPVVLGLVYAEQFTRKPKLIPIYRVRKYLNICLIISIILIFVGTLTFYLKTILISNSIYKGVEFHKLDYVKYYKTSTAQAFFRTTKGTGYNLLADAIRYSTVPHLKAKKLIVSLICCAILACGLIFLYLGFRPNIDAFCLLKSLIKPFYFNVNSQIIVGIILFVVSFIPNIIFNNIYSRKKWLKNIKEQN